MVLITGATGFLGSHLLIKLLEKGEKVRALYRDSSKQAVVSALFSYYNKQQLFEQIQWFEADITDIPSMEAAFVSINDVYHCAAYISFDPDDEEQLRKVNIEGTANIVNFCLVNNVRKLCFVSSIAALGDLQDHEKIITENTEWNAEKYHSDYAISKYGAEMEVWRGEQEGLDVVIVNPGVILGPDYSEKGSGQLFLEVKKGLKYYTKGSTGFIAVKDVVDTMWLLMNSEIKGERFILISENVVFEQLVNTMAIALDSKKPRFYAKKWMTGIVWRLDWILATVFFARRKLSKAMARSLHSTDLYSNEKIKGVGIIDFTVISQVIHETSPFYKNKG